MPVIRIKIESRKIESYLNFFKKNVIKIQTFYWIGLKNKIEEGRGLRHPYKNMKLW